MSTTSRHSSFSRSTAPRPWRSPTKPAPADVSLVFAEPTHVVSPPGAAAMTLPKQHLQPQQDIDSLSVGDRSGSDRGLLRRASQFSLRSSTSESPSPAIVISKGHEGSNNAKETSEVTTAANLAKQTVDLHAGSSPGIKDSPVPAREYKRSGWFNSLRRTDHAKDTPAAQPVPDITVHTCSTEASAMTCSSTVDSTNVVPPLEGNLGSQSQTSKPTPPQSISVVSSSRESNVEPTSFPNSAGPQPIAQESHSRQRSNLSILNPSAPRFTLAMPLLGRPKTPLGKAVGIVSSAPETGITKDAPATERDTGDDNRYSNANMLTSPIAMTSNTDSTNASWWSYIGWGSTALASSPAESVLSTPTTLQSPSIISPPSSPTAPSPPARLSAVATDRSQATDTPIAPLGQPPSTWYPWRWYASGQYEAGLEDNRPKPTAESTETESVNEALAQSANDTNKTTNLNFSTPFTSNPVLATAENRTGWLSVLASASVRVRGVREDGETMETMDISETEAATSQGKDQTSSKSPGVSLPGTPPALKRRLASLNDITEGTSMPPLTKDKRLKREVSSSPEPKKSLKESRPNLVLPTFEDTFTAPPRSIPLPREPSTLRRGMRYLSGFIFPEVEKGHLRQGKHREMLGQSLPRTWSVLGEDSETRLKGAKRVVVVGIHGWFPGSLIRQVVGEPTGTSSKFSHMMGSAVEEYFQQYNIELEKLTKIVLEGEGTIEQRVNILFQEYEKRNDWVEDLQNAHAILFATHSQGSIVTTQLVDRLITEGHIRTHKTSLLDSALSRTPQKVVVLALCGVHIGPLLYLNTSSIVNPYIQYLESAAARELFEFQDSESAVSKTYVKALTSVIDHGVKFTYIASMNDQVVPIYSGIFTTASHPLILRALYVDGDAYHSSDFLSNLLVLLIKILNTGLDDGGLITHLSEVTAGSLSGVGHSTAYEEPATYALAVRFLFETSGVLGDHPKLTVQPFTARAARNDYEIPWLLRDLIAHPDVEALFASDFSDLRAAFDDWHPQTSAFRQIRRKLEPIRRLTVFKL